MVSLAKLPAFLLAVYLMYWSLPLANLFFYIKSWKLIGKRNDIYQWWAAPPPLEGEWDQQCIYSTRG